jgi:hypothetical protein
VHELYRTSFRGDVYPGGRLQLAGTVPSKLGSLVELLVLAITAASADEALR